MEIIRFDSDNNLGVRCPTSGIKIDFQDEDITDYIEDTFVVGVLLSIQPEECAIGGELNEEWMRFYAENSDEVDLEEMISNFPGPYEAIEVNSQGMSCGPVHDTAYYIVPKGGPIKFIPRRRK